MSDPSKPAGSLMRAVWRWHFYAGLLTAPVLLITALTGALYAFREEVTEWPQACLWVTPAGKARPAEEWAGAVASAYPGSKVKRWLLPASASRAVLAELEGKKKDEDTPYRVAVCPYTAEVTGEVSREPSFFKALLGLHRRLYLGWWGRVLVEVATSWAVLLLVTGLYLWWPRAGKAAGVWHPRLWGKPYVVLRDLHAVLGFYLALLLAAVLVTGLFFSVAWGSAAKALFKATGNEPKRYMELPKPPKGAGAPTLTEAVEAGRAMFPGCALEVEAGKKKEPALVKARGWGPKESGRALVGRGGEVLASWRISELPWAVQLRLWVYPVHTGEAFGLATKALSALAALGLALFTVTGVCMWWTRRPVGKLGLPRKPNVPVPAWMIGVMLALGALLPLAGATMLVALACEWALSLASGSR
jgi:uncharacterized iron-regulated membrane protein